MQRRNVSIGTLMTITFADEAKISCLVFNYITEKIELNPLKKKKQIQAEKEQQKSLNEEKQIILTQPQQKSGGIMSFYETKFYKKAIENTNISKIVEKTNDSSDNSNNSVTDEEMKIKGQNEKVITTSLLELKTNKSSKISSTFQQTSTDKEVNTTKRKFSIFDEDDPFTNANKIDTKKLKQSTFKNVLSFKKKKTVGPIKKSIQTHLK